MLTREQAEQFASDWIESWNAHDIDKILSHYTEDFTFYSPIIIKLIGEPTGKLQGKQTIKKYWESALAMAPNLKFVTQDVLVGVQSVTIIYQGIRGLSAEVFDFNEEGKVYRAAAHYLLQQKG